MPATIHPDEMIGTVYTPLIPVERIIPPAGEGVLRFYSMANTDHKLLQVRDSFYELIYRKDHELEEEWFPFEVHCLTVAEAHKLIESMRLKWSPEEQRLKQLRGVLYRETKVDAAEYESFSNALANGVMNFDPRDYDLRDDRSDRFTRISALAIGFGLPGLATCAVILRALNIF